MKKTLLIVPILGIVLLLGACNQTQNQQGDTPPPETENTTQSNTETEQQASNATYRKYNQELFDSLHEKEAIVLFFHASWCSVCQKLEKEIEPTIGSFPEGTNILVVDYDTETALKEKYGITMQATFVVINKNGSVLSNINNPSVAALKEMIKNSI